MIAGACLRGLEQVAYARRAHAYEHLHEVGTGDGDERHARFAGDGPRDQRLTGAGGTDEQHALGNARADVLELAGDLQEVDDFGDLLFHRAVTGNVGEGGFRFVGVVHLGARAPDVHHRAHLSLRAARDEPPECTDQCDHDREAHDRADEVRRLRLVVHVDLRRVELREVGFGDSVGLGGRDEVGLAVDLGCALLDDSRDATARRLVRDALHVAVVGHLHELGVLDVGTRGGGAGGRLPRQQREDREGDDHERQPAGSTRGLRCAGARLLARRLRRPPLVFGAWTHSRSQSVIC